MLTRIFILSIKIFTWLFMFMVIYILSRSALDIYNTFAYDKAIVKESPYGSVPLLENPNNWKDPVANIKSGDFVYVEDWLSGYNNRISFAKVKSKLNEGYINRDLLVEVKVNIKPVISVFFLTILLVLASIKLVKKFHYQI